MVSWLNPPPRKRGRVAATAAVAAAVAQAQQIAPLPPPPAVVVKKNTFKNASGGVKKKAGGQAIIDWIHDYCYVPDGKLLGQKMQLAPWQQDEIKNIYDNPAETRRAILSFGRKNGKSSLAAVLLLVHLCGPRARPNSSMYSTAQSREQASLIFNLASKIVKMSPGLRSIITIKESGKELHCVELGTKYRALSAEASTAYGLSPVFAIHDELGQVRGPRSPLYEAIETATGAQEDPLSIIISTQAPTDADLLSVLIDDALGGHDPRVIVKLYTAPMAMDPFEEDTIRLANPAFGNFLNPVEVMAMAEDARRMPSREAEFRNLILNQRVEASMPFVRPAQWAACGGDVELEKAEEVYAGLDLSEANDLTALVLIGRVDRVWHVRSWFWLPQEGLFDRARNDRVPYDKWAEQGFLETVPGKSITYDRIVPRLVQIFGQYKPRKVAFDRWNFKHLKPWLTHFGFSEQTITEQWVEFGQGTVSMSPALRELESCILDGELAHGMHPILNMCASHAVVDSTDSSNRKLSKKRSAGRIDGMVALAMAFGVAPLKPATFDITTLIA